MLALDALKDEFPLVLEVLVVVEPVVVAVVLEMGTFGKVG